MWKLLSTFIYIAACISVNINGFFKIFFLDFKEKKKDDNQCLHFVISPSKIGTFILKDSNHSQGNHFNHQF